MASEGVTDTGLLNIRPEHVGSINYFINTLSPENAKRAVYDFSTFLFHLNIPVDFNLDLLHEPPTRVIRYFINAVAHSPEEFLKNLRLTSENERKSLNPADEKDFQAWNERMEDYGLAMFGTDWLQAHARANK